MAELHGATDNYLPELLQIEIVDPEQVIYQGQALSLSSKNDQGPFDILPSHTHFISVIKEVIKLALVSKEVKEIEIEIGILRCFNNKVNIYTGF